MFKPPRKRERQLSEADRLLARRVAWDLWDALDGHPQDLAQATATIPSRVLAHRAAGLDPWTVLLIVRLVLWLWNQWRTRRPTGPVPVGDELRAVGDLPE